MYRTAIFMLGANENGELLSASIDETNMATVDNQLYMASQLSGDGVISGWEVTNADNGQFQVNISAGSGKIEGVYVETPNDLQASVPTAVNVYANNTNYIYARLATQSDPSIGGTSPYPSSYTKCVYFGAVTDIGNIPSGAIRIADVEVGTSAIDMTIDNTVRRDISLFSAAAQDLLEYYLLIHKHDGQSPLYIPKIVLTTEVVKSTTTTDYTTFTVSDGSWLNPDNSFPEIPVSNSAVSISQMTDAQVQTRIAELFSQIEVLVDDVVVNCYYQLDHKNGTITFINPLPTGSAVKLKLHKNLSRVQVSGQLEDMRLSSIDGSKITTGRLDPTVLPTLSHIGRINEALVPFYRYTASTADYLAYSVELSGHNYQKVTYVYSILDLSDTIYLGTSVGLLKSVDGGDNYTTITVSDALDAPITEIVRDVDSGLAFLLTYNNIGLLDISDDSVSNISESYFSDETIFYDMAKSVYNNVLYVATNIGLFKTTDFGDTWHHVPMSYLTDPIYAVEVVDENIVYASGDGALYRSEDGGYNWNEIPIFSSSDVVTKLLCLFDGFILAATDSSELWMTRNNGSAWNRVITSSDLGIIYDLFYDNATGKIYILSSTGIFVMANSFAVTATQHYVVSTFSADAAMGSSEVLFGTKNALLYNYLGADDDFFGFKSQFSRNRTPTVYVNDIKVSDYYWYFADGYKVIFREPLNANDIVKIADDYQLFTPVNGTWDPNNTVFPTITYDQVNYVVQGELDRHAQILVYSSNSDEPIDSSLYTIDYSSNTITFTANESSDSLGGVNASEFIDGRNPSQKQIAGQTGGPIYSNESSSEISVSSVSSLTPTGISAQEFRASEKVVSSAVSSPVRDADEMITVALTRIDVYKNGQLVSPNLYDRDYVSGVITFNEQQDVSDELTISIYGTSIVDIGIRTHKEIDDALSEQEMGLTAGMGNVFLNNLGHFILAIKHAIPYDMDGNKLEAYMKNVYYHSIGVDPISDYDVFHSTLDKNISVQQSVLPETFKSVYSILRLEDNPRELLLGTNNGIWQTKDRGIVYNCMTEDSDIELVLALHQSLLTTIHAGTNNSLYNSIDTGDTWQEETCNSNYNLPDVVYSLLTTIDGKLYMGTNDGIYMNYGSNFVPDSVQDESGNSPWIQVGLAGKKVYDLTVDEDNNVLLAAEDGLYKQSGNNWTLLALSGTQCRSVFYDYLRDVLYVGVKNGLYYSLDSGSNMILVNHINDTIITINKDYFGAIWLGGINSLYRVSPAATLSQTAFEEICSVSSNIFPIYAIENDEVTKGHVMIGSKQGLLFISDPQINEILIEGEYLFVATNEGIFRIALNGSREWAEVTEALTDAAYYDIIVANETGELVAGADYGVITSDDMGESWIQRLTTPEPVTQIVEVNTGSDKGIYALSSSIIYKSVDNGHNWAIYLSVNDFADISEFTYFFAHLDYV